MGFYSTESNQLKNTKNGSLPDDWTRFFWSVFYAPACSPPPFLAPGCLSTRSSAPVADVCIPHVPFLFMNLTELVLKPKVLSDASRVTTSAQSNRARNWRRRTSPRDPRSNRLRSERPRRPTKYAPNPRILSPPRAPQSCFISQPSEEESYPSCSARPNTDQTLARPA